MTTTTLAGFRVTYSSGAPSAVAATTMTIVTSDSFSFKYTLDAPNINDYSSITVPAAGITGSAPALTINGTQVNLDTQASIAQIGWSDDTGDKYTLMLKVTMSGVDYFFEMAGDALPAFANLAAYEAFLAGSFASSDVDTWEPTTMKPGQAVRPELMTSFDSETEHDLIVGNASFNDWTTKTLDTGLGNDSVTGTENADLIDLGDGADTVNGLGGNDRLDGEAGNDTILGGAGLDTISGGLGNDIIQGGDDADRISGAEGADSIDGDAGADFIDAGAGNDAVDGGADADTVSGGTGNDVLIGNTGDDSLNGAAGDDTLTGGDGADKASGGAGNDLITGGLGNDTLSGGANNDSISGDDGNDVLKGDSGADTMSGGIGDDTLSGGSDADQMQGDDGNDVLNGDGGNDTLNANDGNDKVVGGLGDDSMTGGAGTDTMNGSAGNDSIHGGNDADTVIGGAGVDTLNGGNGDDVLTGSSGADTFVLDFNAGSDTITDFTKDVDLIAIDLDYGVSSYAEVRAHTVVDGNDLVVTFDNGDTLTLINTKLSALSDGLIFF
ncbi:Hemolysin-type calcium-binding repeat-containing protein [Gemmobacter aquatilis]|uniref:Hemolysin-type calcium-binding repeat-containing protein n=1 Tax=Gemmobacter aquatilis TaxID=933059 RepID=A0A1H8GHQ0_9RHOB|nr:calcium-binding protein [Gemmobacter aquatilis]SEN43522.1 Hemolysin-type calcium-binding repeat-containing protein [Gemmobacter aquatilis]